MPFFAYIRRSVLHVTLSGEGIDRTASRIETALAAWPPVREWFFPGPTVELRFQEGWFGGSVFWDPKRDWQVVEIMDAVIDEAASAGKESPNPRMQTDAAVSGDGSEEERR